MKRKWWIVGILGFVELLICAAMVLALWLGRGVFEGVRFFYVTDTHIEETVEETFVVEGPAVLDLANNFGDMTVTGGEGDKVEVTAHLDLWGSNEEDARQQVDVQMSQDGDRIVIRVERLEYMPVFTVNRPSKVNFEVRVPTETSLQLMTSSGDLVVEGLVGEVDVRTEFGSIEVEDISGPLNARSSSGDVTVADVNDGGDLVVETEFGALALRGVEADDLTVRSSSGKIEAEDVAVTGGVDLHTDFGDVTVHNVTAERLTARSDSGGLDVREAVLAGPLDMEAKFGNVTAVDVDATSYRLYSGSGDLVLTGGHGALDLGTDFGGIEVSGAEGAGLTLQTDSGSITFSGSLRAEGEHRVETQFGDVHLTLPADTAFDLEAETEFGSVETDFAVTVSEFEEKHLVGEVNGGGPLLWIKTGSGSITLESMLESMMEE